MLGIDRDSATLSKARARSAAAGATNIQFIEVDLSQLRIDGQFDAIIGRFILMFLPDPTATLRALTSHLRPGGVIAFQEPSWASFFALTGHLPLRKACGDLICRTLYRAGSQPDMANTLYKGFLDCGYPAPNLRVEVPIENDTISNNWILEVISSLYPRFDELGIETHTVVDFNTLPGRLQFELDSIQSYAPILGLVSAWAQKPPI